MSESEDVTVSGLIDLQQTEYGTIRLGPLQSANQVTVDLRS